MKIFIQGTPLQKHTRSIKSNIDFVVERAKEKAAKRKKAKSNKKSK